MTTLRLDVELSVNADAVPGELADWLFGLLAGCPDPHPALDAVDAVRVARWEA